MILQQKGERGPYIRVDVLADDGTVMGLFDIEFFSKSRASIHTWLKTEFRGKGFGMEMYDKAEELVKDMGRTLVPSPLLSADSLRIWRKRNPSLLASHRIKEDDSRAMLIDRKEYCDEDHIPTS